MNFECSVASIIKKSNIDDNINPSGLITTYYCNWNSPNVTPRAVEKAKWFGSAPLKNK